MSDGGERDVCSQAPESVVVLGGGGPGEVNTETRLRPPALPRATDEPAFPDWRSGMTRADRSGACGRLRVPSAHQTDEDAFAGTTNRTTLSLPHLIIAQLPYPSGPYLRGDEHRRARRAARCRFSGAHLSSDKQTCDTLSSPSARASSAFLQRPPVSATMVALLARSA